MTVYSTSADILRHIQDTDRNCGRACAQMIIAALTLAPTTGVNPTSVSVLPTQATLASREANQPDPPLPADVWLTHPDEMLDLLRKSPELVTLGTRDWRLPAYPTAKRLVGDVLHTLSVLGMPTVVSTRQNDHWVVIKAAHRDDAGRLLIELLDPLDAVIEEREHHYQDECNSFSNGQAYIKYEVTKNALIGLDLVINPRPNPPGMRDYAGKCVGILYGPPPTDIVLDKIMIGIVDGNPGRRSAERPTVDDLRAELVASAAAWALQPVSRFLASAPETVACRWVRGIERPDLEYALLALLSPMSPTGLRRGLMAAFDAGGALQQLQFTNNVQAIQTLTQFAGQDLWFTTRWLPTLPSPFYPFVRDQNDSNRFIRLVNGTVLEA